MTFTRILLWCVVLCTTVLPAVAAAQEPADLAAEVARLRQQVAELSKTPALKVGLVDIVRVFDELDEKIDMNAEISQVEDKRRTTLKDLYDGIKDLDEKLKVLNPESEEGRAALRELEDKKRQLRAKGKALDEHIYNKLYEFTRSAYRKINTEITGYAGEAGIDVVLRVRDPNIDTVDPKAPARSRYIELNRRIEYRSVLYSRSALDFTAAIITRLNKKYEARNAARPSPKTFDPKTPDPKTPE
ncbi:MAG: OmpH family outer membrane protein [Candidatus Brocadiae bacterium]|nr:OmpH family outer membrane protein [Candidatus Brocadiia bacterium]